MKNYLFLALILAFGGCAHDAAYNPNSVFVQSDEDIRANKPFESAVIYTRSEILRSMNLKPSTRLGNDESIDINLGEFAVQSTKSVLSNYLRNITTTTKADALQTGLVIMPDIRAFEYGFYSYDGMDLDIDPYVLYDFRMSIFKNGKEIYNKKLSIDEKVKGERVFFGGGKIAFASIAPLFQKALVDDLKKHENEIISAINNN